MQLPGSPDPVPPAVPATERRSILAFAHLTDIHLVDCQSPARVEHATAAPAFSEAQHFTLVYPIGEKEAWNAGTCCHPHSNQQPAATRPGGFSHAASGQGNGQTVCAAA